MERAPDTVGEIMTVDVVTVDPEASVIDAVRAMVDRDIGSVVVARGEEPLGVFTERDLLRHILKRPGVLNARVSELMSAPVVVAHPDTEVVGAFELMNASRIRRVPIVRSGKLIGIVTERDLLRWVSQVAKE
jgi:CBS domain-containing protein